MTVKDVALMVRLGLTDSEILTEVEKRRLVSPLDAAAEAALASGGATPALVEKLRAKKYTLSPAEAEGAIRAANERQAAAAREQAANVAAFEARQRQLSSIGLRAQTSSALVEMLQGNLVKLRGDEVVPFDATELKQTRIFAIYYSARWCGPCRAFTPRLVDFYRRMKPTHPELEVIFVSSDRDEFNMANYMRTSAMSWPAMRFGTGAALKQYAGDSIPWLVVVNDAGQPLTQNGVDKKYIDPGAVLDALEGQLNKGAK